METLAKKEDQAKVVNNTKKRPILLKLLEKRDASEASKMSRLTAENEEYPTNTR
ncbi:MAG: hypothetical protein WDZ80_00805 [Candidatus Paceibacterota bacterium]